MTLQVPAFEAVLGGGSSSRSFTPVPLPSLLHSYTSTHSLTSFLFTYSPSLVHSSFLSFVLQLFIGRRRQHHIVLHFCQSCLPAGSSLFYKKLLLNLESCLHQTRVIRFVTVYCFNDLVPLYTTTNITAARSLAFAPLAFGFVQSCSSRYYGAQHLF
jgi:hypothetical protein